jgi:hypothetical protein
MSNNNTNAWAVKAFQFAKENLPNLLQECGEGNEDQAMAKLAERYKAHRTEQIKDRTAEIAENRAGVDAALEQREQNAAAEKKRKG